MLRSLEVIGQGLWRQQKTTRALRMEGAADLELWSMRWSKGGRIVFEVALDYSKNRKQWMEMLRLWVRPPKQTSGSCALFCSTYSAAEPLLH